MITPFQAFFEISPYIQARERNVSKTTVGHLSAQDINELTVLVPSSPELLEKAELFDTILSKLMISRNENHKLEELSDWLLPMLMNGQVNVKN
jgi:type I restriction enzyme S subunit